MTLSEHLAPPPRGAYGLIPIDVPPRDSRANTRLSGAHLPGASRIWMHMAASSWPRAPPPFSARAIRAPFTCRAPAAPRSWVTSSWICARPEAPMGWPRDSRPPLGFIGIFPPIFVAPLSAECRLPLPRAEPQGLGLVELAVGGGVMHLGADDVLRPEARFFIGDFAQPLADIGVLEIPLPCRSRAPMPGSSPPATRGRAASPCPRRREWPRRRRRRWGRTWPG